MKFRTKVVAGLSALTLAAGGGIAYAAIPDEDGTIHGCRSGATGALRVVEQSSHCVAGENPLDWNQTGPQGPAGPTGATGPQGPQGEPGGALPEQPVYANGSIRTVQPGQRITILAACGEDNNFATGGGASVTARSDPGDSMVMRESTYTTHPTSGRAAWETVVEALDTNTAAIEVHSFVMCLRPGP